MCPYFVVDFTQDKSGKLHPVIIGGRAFTTESAAQQYVDTANLSRQAEILHTDTMNQSKATQEIKAQLIKKFRNLNQGMARAVHKVR